MISGTQGPLPCFVLHSPTSPPERGRSVSEQLARLGIEGEKIIGVAPGSPEITENYLRRENLWFSKRDLAEAEIAAAIGHRRIWQTILDRKLPAALVLEDDFTHSDEERVHRAIAAASILAGEWDIIKLFEYKQRPLPLRLTTLNDVDFALYSRPSSGLVAYVINARACAALLKIKSVRMPIDEEIRYGFMHKLKVCASRPNVIEDNGPALGGSMIENGRNAIKRRRNLVRTLWGNVLGAYMRAGSR